MINFLSRLISTFFYVGYIPLIPGTFGSIAGLAVFYLTKDNAVVYAVVTVSLLIMGFVASSRAERLFKVKDPRHVVIDEVAGMLISLAGLPYDIRLVVIGFFVFRLLDTLKPYPANGLQKIPGARGIMYDDIVAAIYTNIVLQVVARFIA
jgi:phosphatidylglycerophosphatase A